MPAQGVPWKPHEAMLSFEEIMRIVSIMAELGIRKIKVTGGEPLVRRGVAAFLKALKALSMIEKVTLTTNGILLGSYLKEAETFSQGSLPDGINISLDALNPQRFKRITRYEGTGAEDVILLIDRLLEKGIQVKLNCVPVRSFNEEEIAPIAALAREKEIAVRFIELMPLGSAAAFQPIAGREAEAILEKAFGPLTPFSGIRGNGPAVYYSLPGFAGKIGFINAITQGFCGSCNRLRLTSEGFLKLCLSSNLGLDLRALLRSGASDSELSLAIAEAIAKKPGSHTLSGVYAIHPETHAGNMSAIGG
jgi:cyclic pyranopterin phosphate synthase